MKITSLVSIPNHPWKEAMSHPWLMAKLFYDFVLLIDFLEADIYRKTDPSGQRELGQFVTGRPMTRMVPRATRIPR